MNSGILQFLSIPFSKPLYDGLFGSYQTITRGQGTEYESSRLYDTSDHPKYIDWKTTAKKDTLYTKQYHDEQQLHVCLVLDLGQSMQFGFEGKKKYDIMSNISILLASIVSDHGDALSLITYDKTITSIQLHISGNSIIPHLLNVLKSNNQQLTDANIKSNLTSCISHITSCITHPTHFIFITDDEDTQAIPSLKDLTHYHEISYIQIQHSLEQQGLQSSIPLSNGIHTANHLGNSYSIQRKHENNIRSDSLKKCGIHYICINEKDNVQKSLLSLWRF